MKKGFSLIEAAVAIAILVVSFTAIVSIINLAQSNTYFAKTKLIATAVAQNIIEIFKKESRTNGIADFDSLKSTLEVPVTADGFTFTPQINLYYLSATTVRVDVKINWIFKQSESITITSLMSNLNNNFIPYLGPTTVLPQ